MIVGQIEEEILIFLSDREFREEKEIRKGLKKLNSLYHTLKNLIDKNLIIRIIMDGLGRKFNYYRISEEGLDYLKENKIKIKPILIFDGLNTKEKEKLLSLYNNLSESKKIEFDKFFYDPHPKPSLEVMTKYHEALLKLMELNEEPIEQEEKPEQIIASIKLETKKTLITFFETIEKFEYSDLNIVFNKKENSLIFYTMDSSHLTIFLSKFNNVKITENIEEKAIEDFAIKEFIGELKKIKNKKEVSLDFYEDHIEAVFDNLKKKPKLLYSEEVYSVPILENFSERYKKSKFFEIDFALFSELIEDLDLNIPLVQFYFSQDLLEVKQSIKESSFSVLFEKELFIKYEHLNKDDLVGGEFMYNQYIRTLPLFSKLGIIKTNTFFLESIKVSAVMGFHFNVENLDLEINLVIAPRIEEEAEEGIPSKKTEQWILRKKAEAIKLKLIRKSNLGIYIVEEEQLDSILRKLRKPNIFKEKLEKIEEKLENIEFLINLKLQPLEEKALKTFYIPF